ncbi:MAG: DNA mismatch repair endonuclease MutL [Cyanobacteria bacterium J007]|jgi:DNA mismatch repair protein MutL|nr:MAG: DNA mismatch repair endonuclease MutL [Cyanobacteria bacterium J007]
MASSIQYLPREVVYTIAAGEVIDSIAAGLRELIENAIDADATRIVISLWPDRWSLRVVDNGSGMNLENLKLAAAAHTTSKIHHLTDLSQIKTLGFRGEALYSLAHLAKLDIFSRSRDGEAWHIIYDEQGLPVDIEPTAIAPGTIVNVSNLFANWEARRQGLPSMSQQLKAVQLTLQQMALCHPNVTWIVKQNDRQWMTLTSVKSPRERLPQILGNLDLSDLKSEQLHLENGTIDLVLGLPDRAHRRRPDWIKVAVNGRVVRCRELEQTIISSFARTLPRDRYPICFLHLKLPPDRIDWNRHPAKTELYLHDLADWQEQVKQTIAQCLKLNDPSLDPDSQKRTTQLLKVSEEKAAYRIEKKLNSSPEQQQNIAEQPALIPLRAVAQVNKTYIVGEHENGLWLIEQHIAHERILYEELCDRWQIVPVETPIILNQLTTVQLEQLDRLGLEVTPFGNDLWAIRSVPQLLAEREDCSDALIELSCAGDLQAAQVATACRSAIRNGMTLTVPEMQTILDRWQRTRHPHTCPHGRPIYLALEESSLARFFRRQWVIGKSHGI